MILYFVYFLLLIGDVFAVAAVDATNKQPTISGFAFLMVLFGILVLTVITIAISKWGKPKMKDVEADRTSLHKLSADSNQYVVVRMIGKDLYYWFLRQQPGSSAYGPDQLELAESVQILEDEDSKPYLLKIEVKYVNILWHLVRMDEETRYEFHIPKGGIDMASSFNE